MTDLERLGLGLVGFALAVVVGSVLLGLVAAWSKKAGSWIDERSLRLGLPGWRSG